MNDAVSKVEQFASQPPQPRAQLKSGLAGQLWSVATAVAVTQGRQEKPEEAAIGDAVFRQTGEHGVKKANQALQDAAVAGRRGLVLNTERRSQTLHPRRLHALEKGKSARLRLL